MRPRVLQTAQLYLLADLSSPATVPSTDGILGVSGCASRYKDLGGLRRLGDLHLASSSGRIGLGTRQDGLPADSSLVLVESSSELQLHAEVKQKD